MLPAQAAELGSPLITNFEPEQYNASSQNWVAVQDHRGVMYFANTAGILEFDGQRWQLISTPENTTVRALVCGPDGTIYYGSVGDFGYLVASPTGKVSVVSLKEAIPKNDRVFNDVWQALSSRYGIYFLSRSKIFRLEKGKVHPLQGKFASSQACLLNEIVFYADMDKGLCMLEGDQVVPIPQFAKVYNSKRIALTPFGRQRLLVGRITGDFLQLDLESLWDENSQRFDISRPASKEIVKPFPCELGAFLMENNGFLYKLIPLGTDAFAISTLRGGIVTFNRAGKVIRVINKNRGLLDNTVGDIFMDRARNMWACNNSGISHIELSVPQSYFGARNGINGRSLCAQFYGGRMYVGTIRNLLIQAPYRFDLQNDQQLFMPVKNTPNQAWQILDMGEELLAAGSGLFRIRGEGAIKVQGSDPTSYCLGTSKRWPDHLFIGLVGGMEVFKRTAGQWQPMGRVEAIKDTIRGIAQDINGDLWATTETRGLLRLHFSGAIPTQTVIHQFGPEQGLPGLSHLLAVVSGDILFVLSPVGLFRTTIPLGAAQAPERIRFTPDTTLGKSFIEPPVALNSMVFDKEGSAFFSTPEGVVWAIPGKDGQYRMELRPFRGVPAQDGTMYLHHDGSLWLPGKILYRFDPKAQKDYDQPFAVMVRKVISKSRQLIFEGTHGYPGSAFGEQHTVFESSQDPLETLELPYRENALSFEFTAAFYEKPGSIRFQYLLEGFDKEWSDWTGETLKEYSYLPEGKYRFRVRAKNIYGTMGREAIYSLRILPPWFRTIWAYILWIIGGSAALVGIIYLNTLKLRRQKEHLENIVAERTQQLREASEQLREASLTDPLTGLRNRRFIHEVLQTDISAFIKYKHYLLNAKDQRRTAHEDTVFGLFLIDIDFFKKVNDIYGHDAGDRVLKQFAAILTGSMRPDDVVMRVGGEEFLAVLKKTIPEYLHIFVAKILEKVAAMPFAIGGGTTIHKTCSIGYASFPVYKEQPGLLTFEQSTMIADLGLFHAKNHGRNQGICLKSGPRMPSGEEIIQKTVTSLEFALKEGYLQIDNISNRPSD